MSGLKVNNCSVIVNLELFFYVFSLHVALFCHLKLLENEKTIGICKLKIATKELHLTQQLQNMFEKYSMCSLVNVLD